MRRRADDTGEAGSRGALIFGSLSIHLAHHPEIRTEQQLAISAFLLGADRSPLA